MALRNQVLSGVMWTGIGRAANQAVQFCVYVLLARLLSPQDFGLMAMVLTILGFFSLFSELGFGAAVVQRTNLDEQQRCSVFWANLAVAGTIAALLVGIAPFVADFYRAPSIVPMLRLLSLNLIISASYCVHAAMVTRQLDFRRLATVNTVGVVVGGIVAAGCAIAGLAVWSLIFQSLAATVVNAVLFWRYASWMPKLHFHWSSVKPLVLFGGNLTAFNVVNYWVRNIDNLLIGRFMGAQMLGIYSRAYNTMLLPLSLISGPVGNVLFPALSQIQNDAGRTKSAYLRSMRLIALITFPMMLGLVPVASPFINAIFGAKWSATVPLLQMFCLLGLVQSIGTTAGWLYTAQGRTDLLFRVSTVISIPLIGSIVLGIVLGTVESVVICYSVTGILVEFPSMMVAGHLVGLKLREILRHLSPIFYCSALMSALVYLIGLTLPDGFGAWPRLALQVPAGLAIYMALLPILRVKAWGEARGLLFRQRGPLRPGESLAL